MKAVATISLLVFALFGCTRASVARYVTFPPNPNVESVEVFTAQVPDRDFQEIGLVEVVGGAGTSYAKLIQRAQRDAAEIGAEAIIVSRRPIEGVSAFTDPDWLGSGNAVTMASATETPRIWVVALRWKGEP